MPVCKLLPCAAQVRCALNSEICCVTGLKVAKVTFSLTRILMLMRIVALGVIMKKVG